MKKINEEEVPFKHETYGSKYLFKGEKFTGGVAHLPPGKEIQSHVHDDETELFYFISGEPLFIVNNEEHRIKEGDAFTITAGETHCLKNDTDKKITLNFLKIKEG